MKKKQQNPKRQKAEEKTSKIQNNLKNKTPNKN